MKQILIAHSTIVTCVLEGSGKIQHMYDDVDDDFIVGIQGLQTEEPTVVVTDSKFISDVLNQASIKHKIDINRRNKKYLQ